MSEVALLADHLETIPTLAGWFRQQWPDYYAGETAEETALDFRSEVWRVGLPVWLLAFADGEAAGTGPLRE